MVATQLAKDRIAALTDTEIAKLADQIDSLPAGAGGEILILIALLLMIVFIGSNMYTGKK